MVVIVGVRISLLPVAFFTPSQLGSSMLEPVQPVAPVTAQVSVVVPPPAIVVGAAVKLSIAGVACAVLATRDKTANAIRAESPALPTDAARPSFARASLETQTSFDASFMLERRPSFRSGVGWFAGKRILS